MMTTALILSIILFIAGLVGTILPILPGAILIYGGMLLYGFMTNFATLDAKFFLLQALVLVLIFSVDFLASAVGTRRSNGSKQAAGGAIIGTLLGLIFFGPLGIVIGPFLGAVGAELLRGQWTTRTVHLPPYHGNDGQARSSGEFLCCRYLHGANSG